MWIHAHSIYRKPSNVTCQVILLIVKVYNCEKSTIRKGSVSKIVGIDCSLYSLAVSFCGIVIEQAHSLAHLLVYSLHKCRCEYKGQTTWEGENTNSIEPVNEVDACTSIKQAWIAVIGGHWMGETKRTSECRPAWLDTWTSVSTGDWVLKWNNGLPRSCQCPYK